MNITADYHPHMVTLVSGSKVEEQTRLVQNTVASALPVAGEEGDFVKTLASGDTVTIFAEAQRLQQKNPAAALNGQDQSDELLQEDENLLAAEEKNAMDAESNPLGLQEKQEEAGASLKMATAQPENSADPVADLRKQIAELQKELAKRQEELAQAEADDKQKSQEVDSSDSRSAETKQLEEEVALMNNQLLLLQDALAKAMSEGGGEEYPGTAGINENGGDRGGLGERMPINA